MPRFKVSAPGAVAKGFSTPPGSMTSNELTVQGGVDLLVPAITTLAARVAGKSFTVTATNPTAARNQFVTKMNQENIRTYRNAADTADITLSFSPTQSSPAGSTWTPTEDYYLYAVQVSGSDKYLAYDQPSGGGYNQLEAKIVIEPVTE